MSFRKIKSIIRYNSKTDTITLEVNKPILQSIFVFNNKVDFDSNGNTKYITISNYNFLNEDLKKGDIVDVQCAIYKPTNNILKSQYTIVKGNNNINSHKDYIDFYKKEIINRHNKFKNKTIPNCSMEF